LVGEAVSDLTTSEQKVQVELTREEVEAGAFGMVGTEAPKESLRQKLRAALSSPQGPDGCGSEEVERFSLGFKSDGGAIHRRDERGGWVRFTDYEEKLRQERDRVLVEVSDAIAARQDVGLTVRVGQILDSLPTTPKEER
jgi:hypothetical protein